jgi:hypothetical protein
MSLRSSFLAGTVLAGMSLGYAGRSYGATCVGSFTTPGYQQFCTVGRDGTYRLIATGAQGSDYWTTWSGGRGARTGGDFVLTAGTVLHIAVGRSPPDTWRYGGGGSGSFVALGDDALTSLPLVVAGGGGAANGEIGPVYDNYGRYGPVYIGYNFLGSDGGAGGASVGGNGSSGNPHRGEGRGFYDTPSREGRGFARGGRNSSYYGDWYAGGGGGFTGGFSGPDWRAGGGGTSFIAPGATNAFNVPGVRSGRGSVRIKYVPAIPLPGGAGLMLAGLGALAGAGAMRRRSVGGAGRGG